MLSRTKDNAFFLYFRSIMSPQIEVRTENTTEEDRRLMRTVLQKPLRVKLILYLPLSVVCIIGLIIINRNDYRFDLDDTKRGIWNVVLVLLALFPLRLTISEWMSYTKDLGNFQVKVAKGKVKDASSRTITIGTYEFTVSALKDLVLQEGEEVSLRAGYKTNNVFWLEKTAN
jgi:hypothetical protein